MLDFEAGRTPLRYKIKQRMSLTSEEQMIEEIDCVPPNAKPSRLEALVFVSEDNDAVIKMIIKGRSEEIPALCACLTHLIQSHCCTQSSGDQVP